MTPSVSLTTAARFDHFVLHQKGLLVPDVGFPASAYNERTIDQPSFNLGLVWKPSDTDTVRLLGARGLQLPSIYDLGLQDRQAPGPDGQGYLFLGNPGVSAAVINNVELDWDRALPSLQSTGTHRDLRAAYQQHPDQSVRGDHVRRWPHTQRRRGATRAGGKCRLQLCRRRRNRAARARGIRISVERQLFFYLDYRPSCDQPDRHLQPAEFPAGNTHSCPGRRRRI